MLAFLISAYRDPAHLARLVSSLEGDARFFVHIDARVDDAPFRAALPGSVTFVKRHRVSWGGWEQVEYQREMLEAALRSGEDFSHLVCLSGQDYPLWSNSHIHQFFEENKDREIIAGYNITRGDNAAQLRKVTRIHPFRDLAWKSQWWRNKAIVLSRHTLSLFGVRRKPRVEIDGRECDIFFGSDYWAITPACARHVVSVLRGQPAVSRYFRTTFVPSEMCLQTIIFNSPFASRAMLTEGHYPGLTSLTPLHYINYGASIKILTESDWDILQRSGKMFCRKIITGESDALAAKIDIARA